MTRAATLAADLSSRSACIHARAAAVAAPGRAAVASRRRSSADSSSAAGKPCAAACSRRAASAAISASAAARVAAHTASCARAAFASSSVGDPERLQRCRDLLGARDGRDFGLEGLPPLTERGQPGVEVSDLGRRLVSLPAQLGDPSGAARLAGGCADVLGGLLGAATDQRSDREAAVEVEPRPAWLLAERERAQQPLDDRRVDRLTRHRREDLEQRGCRRRLSGLSDDIGERRVVETSARVSPRRRGGRPLRAPPRRQSAQSPSRRSLKSISRQSGAPGRSARGARDHAGGGGPSSWAARSCSISVSVAAIVASTARACRPERRLFLGEDPPVRVRPSRSGRAPGSVRRRPSSSASHRVLVGQLELGQRLVPRRQCCGRRDPRGLDVGLSRRHAAGGLLDPVGRRALFLASPLGGPSR